jgi:hypothetical protein
MKFAFACRCGRGRGGIPKVEKVAQERHHCPFAAIVWGVLKAECDCCSSCTVLCLPLKVLRDRASIVEKKGDAIPSLYVTCKLEDEKPNPGMTG